MSPQLDKALTKLTDTVADAIGLLAAAGLIYALWWVLFRAFP